MISLHKPATLTWEFQRRPVLYASLFSLLFVHGPKLSFLQIRTSSGERTAERSTCRVFVLPNVSICPRPMCPRPNSLGYCIPWIKRPLDIASLRQSVPWIPCPWPHLALGAVLVVFLWRWRKKIGTIPQSMSKVRYLKKSPKPCWPIRSKETWTKHTPTTLLNQRKLALTAGNTLFA